MGDNVTSHTFPRARWKINKTTFATAKFIISNGMNSHLGFCENNRMLMLMLHQE